MSLKSKVFLVLGIYALLGIYLVKKLLLLYNLDEEGVNLLPIDFFEIFLFVIVSLVTIISIFTANVIIKRNKKKVSKKIKIHILIPMAINFILIFFLIKYNYYIIAPVSIVFFGLILLNLNRLNIGKYLSFGFAEIILGIIAFLIGTNSLIFLGLGLGVFPVIFGLYNFKKV
jgi:hypothetical protein